MAEPDDTPDHIDKDKLVSLLNKLQNDENLIPDIPHFCQLTNLRVKKRPKESSTCPCDDNSKGLKYNKCCLNVDNRHKKVIISEIKEYLESNGVEKGREVVYV